MIKINCHLCGNFLEEVNNNLYSCELAKCRFETNFIYPCYVEFDSSNKIITYNMANKDFSLKSSRELDGYEWTQLLYTKGFILLRIEEFLEIDINDLKSGIDKIVDIIHKLAIYK